MKRRKNKYKLLILLAAFIAAGVGIFVWKNSNQKPEPVALISNSPVKYEDFHLEIAKLNLDSPVIPDVPGNDKKAYFKALEGGVAHFAGTKKPGEGGLIFIFAHSSFFPWAEGEYKEIFKNLDELAVDDEISVWYNQKEYKYKVTESKIVSPQDVSVLKPTSEETLVLMTCWPPGTTQKRLIIVAKP